MKTLLIIQARVGSTRLPNKVLMPLGHTTVLDYVVKRCQAIEAVDEVVVATTTSPGDELITKWCTENDVPSFRGSEEDVLDRYYQCARKYVPEYVVRATSDTPFVDMHMGNDAITALHASNANFMQIYGTLPRGLTVEALTFEALEHMHNITTEKHHREHVTAYGYEHRDAFQWEIIEAPQELQHPSLRITVDTEEDYELCTHIANHFDGNVLVPVQEVVDYLLANPEVAKINAHIQQKPLKG